MKYKTLFITKAAIIAVLYASATLVFAPISYGMIQFRVSEALMLLAAFTPAAIPGLYIGCVIANLVGGFGIIDVFFGGIATFLAAFCTHWISLRLNVKLSTVDISKKLKINAIKPFILPLPTILFNGFIVGGYLPFIITESTVQKSNFFMVLALSILAVMLGETVITYALGVPLYFGIRRTNIFHVDTGLINKNGEKDEKR